MSTPLRSVQCGQAPSASQLNHTRKGLGNGYVWRIWSGEVSIVPVRLCGEGGGRACGKWGERGVPWVLVWVGVYDDWVG